MEEVTFRVYANGRASLKIGDKRYEVGVCSGLPQAIQAFNDHMRKYNLAYRLESGWPEMMKNLESK